MALDMTTALTINAKVTGQQQINGLTNSLGNATTKANGLSGAFGKLRAASTSLVGVIGAAGVVAALKKSVDVFGEFQAQTKLLENGLKNVGAQSGELAKLQKVASDLGEATLFNEEDFRQGFGLLTSFGNIGVDSYERVAKAAADVAYTSGTEVSAAFMQLAKALNDPAKGLTALGRAGVQFSEEQKSVIEGLVESGKLAEAQNLILKELEKQYGGNSVAAAQGLAGAFDTLNEKIYDLNVAIGDNLSQVLTPLVQLLATIVGAIASAPEPVQTLVVAVGGLVVALTALGGVLAIGGPIVGALSGLIPILAGIPAVLAGWAGAIGPVVSALLGLGKILIAVFSGPAGWVALAIAAGVAIYAFRDQIGAAFKAIGDVLVNAAKAFYETFVRPVINFARDAYEGIVNAFRGLGQALGAPFRAVADFIRGYMNGIISVVERAINAAISAINALVRQANRALSAVRLPQIPLASPVSLPRFANGGVVDGPTLAMVGEGGEREYIIPERKMARASANYLMGMRGGAVIPAFAQGGVVNGGANIGNTSINVTTGPVLQQDGKRYVTMNDLEQALNTVTASLLGNNRSAGGRRFQGV